MMLSICLSVRLLSLPHVFSQVKNLSHHEICVCGGGLLVVAIMAAHLLDTRLSVCYTRHNVLGFFTH